MNAEELVENYANIAKGLSEALSGSTRRPQRTKAYVDYLLALHELQRAAFKERPKKNLAQVRSLLRSMRDCVAALLAPALRDLEKAVEKESKFSQLVAVQVLSYDDGDFWGWVSDRAGQCWEDVRDADGIGGRLDAAGDCLADLLEGALEQFEKGSNER